MERGRHREVSLHFIVPVLGHVSVLYCSYQFVHFSVLPSNRLNLRMVFG